MTAERAGHAVAAADECKQNASMPSLLVRDLPADVHAELQRRAAAEGRSLQSYVSRELSRLVERPSLDDVLARIERRRGGRVGLTTAVEDLAGERPER